MSKSGKFKKIPERKAGNNHSRPVNVVEAPQRDSRKIAGAPLEQSDSRKPARLRIKNGKSGAAIDLIVDLDDGDDSCEEVESRVSKRRIPAAHVPVRPCQTASKTGVRKPFAKIQAAAPAPEPPPVDSTVQKESLSTLLEAVKRRFDGHQDWFNLPKFSLRQKIVISSGVLAVVFTLLFLFAVWSRGGSSRPSAVPLAGEAALDGINKSFARLAEGNAIGALETLRDVEAKFGDVPSLDYITALAAMHAGDHEMAENRARASIEKGELVSDSLVIQSMAEISELSRGSGMRDPKALREAMLRRAVRSNPANPFPMIELASLLRSQSRLEEAKAVLTAAKNRLHPIDTHAVVETSLLLTELQTKPDSELPSAVDQGTLPEMFASIYISLRRGRSDLAAKALEKCRMISSPDLFDYILSDPAFASLSDVPGRM